MRVGREVSTALLDAGAELVFCTVRENDALEWELRTIDVPYFSLGARTSGDYPRAVAKCSRLIRKAKIDVLHCSEPIAASVGQTASLVARRGKRLYDRQHSDADWRQSILSKYAARTAETVRVPSAAAAEWAVLQDRVPRSKVRVVPNAAATPRRVDDGEILRIKNDLGIPPDAAVVGSVARLREGKGLQVAIAALPRIVETIGRPVHYVIVGDGPFRPTLEALAADSEVVHLVGEQSDVAPWHALPDVVLMPSFNESFGIAAVETMAAGRPLVASAVGGLREIVKDGDTGILVPPHNAEVLAKVTASLLASPALRRRLGDNARERYQARFTMTAFGRGMMDCYRALTNDAS